MKPRSDQKLFSPVQIGPLTLKHCVVMAALTRSRSRQPGDIPAELMVEYYGQRASEGGLIISEATSISIAGRGWYGTAGLYSDEQVEGWKKVIAAVRAKGGSKFSQLWHVGRSSNTVMTGGGIIAARSIPSTPADIPITRSPIPTLRHDRRTLSQAHLCSDLPIRLTFLLAGIRRRMVIRRPEKGP